MARKYGKKNVIKVDPLAYNICLLGEPKIGKEQPISEPVLLECGWTPMGNVKIGDRIYGQDGNIYNVTGVYPQGIKDVYEITFSDGTKTRCGHEHLWHVHTKKQRENMRKFNDYRFTTKPLKEIIKDYKKEHHSNSYKSYHYKYSIPINSEIEFTQTEELSLNPYIFGLLLGDGGFTGNVVTFTNPETELFEQLEQGVKELNLELHYRDFENHRQATIVKNDNEEEHNQLNIILKKLSLFGCDSRQKFIPKQYIYTTIENRIKLLSGIINTDGHVYEGVSIHVCSYSEQLAKDVTELARSLGYVAIFNSWDRTDENSTKKYETEIEYRVTIIGDYSKLNLSTKHKNKLKTRCNDYCKSIVDIQLIRQEESQCIMVDNPQHLYITNDYIVTHNTSTIKEMLEKLVGEDGYMFLEMAGEAGADAISNIVYEDIDDWEDLDDIIEDIEYNRNTEYANLKTVVADTYDGWIKLAEKEAIRLWNKAHPDKFADSIDSAWNGFQKGQAKAFELMFDIVVRLRKIGVSMIIIGHIKNRELTDIATGTTYQTLTSDVEKIYFNLLKKKMHFIGLAYYDRTIITEKTGKKNIVTKKEETRNKLTKESRKIKFRDDNMALDSGSRFADIVEEIPLDADSLINALQDAIKAEHNKQSNVKSVEETKEIQEKEKEKVIEENATKKKEEIDEKKELETKKILLEKFKTTMNILKTDGDNVKKVSNKLKELELLPKELESSDIEKLKELVEFMEVIAS